MQATLRSASAGACSSEWSEAKLKLKPRGKGSPIWTFSSLFFSLSPIQSLSFLFPLFALFSVSPILILIPRESRDETLSLRNIYRQKKAHVDSSLWKTKKTKSKLGSAVASSSSSTMATARRAAAPARAGRPASASRCVNCDTENALGCKGGL